MAKNLIVIESPKKAGSYLKALGNDFEVVSSYGHCIDLPPSKLGINIKKGFSPTFEVLDGKNDVLKVIKSKAKKAKKVFLMPDPDREGEAIAWHILNHIKNHTKAEIFRATTNEMTQSAIVEAINNPSGIDMQMIDAYQTRRLLDRLCGYKTSFLTQQATGGRSVGRVQSAVLRILAERELEIKNFVPEEYWVLTAHLLSSKNAPYTAVLESKIKVKNEKQASEIYEAVIDKQPVVHSVEKKEVNSNPFAPFTTSSLIQASSSILGWASKRTMKVAQSLYEAGYITYMRTDSPTLAKEAVSAIRSYVEHSYGKDYLPGSVKKYAAKKGAQEGHECCRPTDVTCSSAGSTDDETSLYEIIWRRTISSQMSPGRDEQTRVVTRIGDYNFVSNGKIRLFDGYRKVWIYSSADDTIIPPLFEGENCSLSKLDKEQKFTTPPPRYSEGSITKQCEKLQIGRPSTYAQCIQTLLNRDYVNKKGKSLQATDLGIKVVDFLKSADFCFVDIDFTAEMEKMLDDIAGGKEEMLNVLKNFWTRLKEDIAKGKEVKAKQQVTEHKCPKCGNWLLLKHSRFGPFYACEKYSKKDEEGSCAFTAKVGEHGEPIEKVQKPKEYAEFPCKSCGAKMIKRTSKYGDFYGCSAWPKCKTTADLDGVFKEKKPKKYKKFKKKAAKS